MHERSAVKNSFSTYVWSKVDSCFCEFLWLASCRIRMGIWSMGGFETRAHVHGTPSLDTKLIFFFKYVCYVWKCNVEDCMIFQRDQNMMQNFEWICNFLFFSFVITSCSQCKKLRALLLLIHNCNIAETISKAFCFIIQL